ncbi:helix-turn-helix domain-containing protein [Brevibacterium casei]
MTKTSFDSIGQAVRTARATLGLTQGQLAQRLNSSSGSPNRWTQGKVSRVESFDREMSFQELMQLIDVLGVDAFHNTHELDGGVIASKQHSRSAGV